MRPISGLVALEKECAIRRRDLVTGLANERDARIGQPAPLLLDLLALVVVERREEIGEVEVTSVAPVKLHAVTDEHARCRPFACLLCVGKQDMQRREAVLQLTERSLEQRATCRWLIANQPRPRHRCERNRGDELWVVT